MKIGKSQPEEKMPRIMPERYVELIEAVEAAPNGHVVPVEFDDHLEMTRIKDAATSRGGYLRTRGIRARQRGMTLFFYKNGHNA